MFVPSKCILSPRDANMAAIQMFLQGFVWLHDQPSLPDVREMYNSFSLETRPVWNEKGRNG